MINNSSSFYLALLLTAGGITLILLALNRKRKIELTKSNIYLRSPIKILNVNLIENNSNGEVSIGPLTDKASIVLVKYQYEFQNKIYENHTVFPNEIEWIKPRVSSFNLFEQLKSGQLSHCYINSVNPTEALLFLGWTPYLKQHILGVFSAGVLIFATGMFFAYIS